MLRLTALPLGLLLIDMVIGVDRSSRTSRLEWV